MWLSAADLSFVLVRTGTAAAMACLRSALIGGKTAPFAAALAARLGPERSHAASLV